MRDLRLSRNSRIFSFDEEFIARLSMVKQQPVPAAEFTRNFGRYRMVAQKGAVPVTSHGQITGYFVPADQYEEFERLRSMRQSFATVDLSEEKVRAIAASRMDERHDHLNALLDDSE